MPEGRRPKCIELLAMPETPVYNLFLVYPNFCLSHLAIFPAPINDIKIRHIKGYNNQLIHYGFFSKVCIFKHGKSPLNDTTALIVEVST